MCLVLCNGLFGKLEMMCFNNASCPIGRNAIILIISLTMYWTGDGEGEMQAGLQNWLPTDMENFPLDTYSAGEEMEMVTVEDEQDGLSGDEE